MTLAPVDRPAVAIVGLGLIGASLALRLAQHGHQVTAYDADRQTRDNAVAAGLSCASSLPDLLTSVPSNGIVVLAVPLPALIDLLAEVARHTDDTVTITDTASVKSPVHRAAVAAGLAGRFVGAHPMAGTTESGFTAAEPDLLAGARWVVTLEPDTDLTRWLSVTRLVLGIGGTVAPASSRSHDESVAWISHLPHVLAEALAAGAPSELALGLAAGSFRDATRVALTRPELVSAMLTGNAEALGHAIDVLVQTLQEVRSSLGHSGMDTLIAAGHLSRSAWPAVPDGARTIEIDLTRPDASRELIDLGARGGYLLSTDSRTVSGLVSPKPAAGAVGAEGSP